MINGVAIGDIKVAALERQDVVITRQSSRQMVANESRRARDKDFHWTMTVKRTVALIKCRPGWGGKCWLLIEQPYGQKSYEESELFQARQAFFEKNHRE
jgi:hypothetical protein